VVAEVSKGYPERAFFADGAVLHLGVSSLLGPTRAPGTGATAMHAYLDPSSMEAQCSTQQ
jgi:hypothetical protein